MLPRLSGTLEFDGIMNDEAWESIEPLPLIRFIPDYGTPPGQKTILKVAYDNDYLYLGAVMHDSLPEKLKIQFRRDDWKFSCDWVGLILDSFTDNENSLNFSTSPSGGRTDVAFSNDFSNVENDMNVSWNTFWDARAGTDPDGWHAELRIPFSSLRFHEENGEVVMGLTAWRYISNSSETYVFPAMDNSNGFIGIYKASETQKVLLRGITSKNPFYITPYILGGLGHEFLLNDAGTDYTRHPDKTWGLGLDVKYRLTDNLTMDLTVNTDFAQVEADEQVVNLTRFSLFFPEKRLFFQERRSNFEFNFDLQNRLFYTRRVGIHDGSPVPIYGGARLVGRIGSWDLGFLSMQTAPAEELFSENFTVLRLRRQVINPSTYVGGILTNRMDFKGTYNTAYGIDGLFRIFGEDYLKVMWAQTFEDGLANQALSLQPARVYLNWERRTRQGLIYNAGYSRAGQDYSPGIGYERRVDYSNVSAKAGYGWINDQGRIRAHNVTAEGLLYTGNADHRMESSELSLNWEFETRENMVGEISGKRNYDNLVEAFYLSENDSVPAGSYTFYNLVGTVTTPRGKLFNVNSIFEIGQYYDGTVYSIGITPDWIIRNTVQLKWTYQFNRALFPAREMQFDAHVVRLNTLVTLGPNFSISAFVQYNSAIDAILANFRLRYNPKEGNDFYIVYNEGYNSDRYREFPVLPLTIQRILMIKYTYTFIL